MANPPITDSTLKTLLKRILILISFEGFQLGLFIDLAMAYNNVS